MMPMSVGGSPRKKPAKPSCWTMRRAMSTGLRRAIVLDDCNCVLMTSSGLVMQEAIVPATPPEKSLFQKKKDTSVRL